MSLRALFRRWFAKPEPAPVVQSAGFQILRAPVGRGSIEVAVWYPTLTPPQTVHYGTAWVTGYAAPDAPVRRGAWPLVVFSHGYSGSGVGSTAICERLAAAGYVVAAPDHSDAITGSRISGTPTGGIEDAMRDLSERPPSLETHGYRIEEVRAVVERLRSSERFSTTNQVVLIGHSLGGWSVFQAALAGLRINALVSYSMGELHWLLSRKRFFGRDDLQRINVPVAYFVGSREIEVLRGLASNAAHCYENTPSASLVGVGGGDHFVYVDRDAMRDGHGGTPEQLRFIADKTIDFIRSVLK